MISDQIYLSFDIADYNDSNWWYCEFEKEGGDIEFHISVRKDKGQLVFNQKNSGEWGAEKILQARFAYQRYVHVVVFKSKIYFYLGDQPKFKVDVKEDYRQHPINSSCNAGVRISKSEYLNRTATKNSLITEKIGGKTISLYAAAKMADISATIESDLQQVKDFMGVASLTPFQVFVEFSNSKGCVASLVSAAYPQSIVISIVVSTKEKKVQEKFLRDAGFTNVYVLLEIDLLKAMSGSDSGSAFDWSTLLPLSSQSPEWLKGAKVAFIGWQQREALLSNKGLLYSILNYGHDLNGLCLAEDDVIPIPQLRLSSIFGDCHVNVRNTPWYLRWAANEFEDVKPQLDIMVALYNAEDYIVECIESMLCSDRDDIKILVVDDGASDNSVAIVEDAFFGNSQVEVVSKANGGCASARNYGRLFSRASHVTFVDADDFVDQDFFADLFDLAMYSGREIVQAGFDFYDLFTEQLYTPSYEDNSFKNERRIDFGDKKAFHLDASRVIGGQPSIWRRVYRRDFLDNKDLYFPEHIRAFDDWILHTCSLYFARDILMLDGPKYHYRQHPNQDIKQGDERHFYELEMARLILNRSLKEGWDNFNLVVPTIVNSINWSIGSLREDLLEQFVRGSAQLWVMIEKSYGAGVFGELGPHSIKHPDFKRYFEAEMKSAEGLKNSYSWSYMNGAIMQPETLKMVNSLGIKR